MYPVLLALLPIFLALALASPEPAALIPFQQITRQSPSSAATPTPRVTINHDVHPLVLVSTVDGALHAVDRRTGEEKWILDEGEPLVGGRMRGNMEEEFIVEPLSGSLYAFEEQEGERPKMRKLPLSVEQLIELSPFTFPDHPSQIFTGSKHTSLISIDLRNGEQIDCFSPSALNFSQFDDSAVCENEELDELERGKALSPQDTLFVGRTDYRLTIHSPPSSSSGLATYTSTVYANQEKKNGPSIQEISYSTYTPNTFHRTLADTWQKSGVNRQRWGPDNEEPRIRVELGFDGKALGVKPGGGIVWNKELGSVGIGVYEILIPREGVGAPILVPQSPAYLPALFPEPADPRTFNIHRSPPATYIGTLPRSFTLPPSTNSSSDSVNSKDLHFALSSSSYPLINFARPPQPGSFSDGLFYIAEDVEGSKGLLPYLIDPPKGVEDHDSIVKESHIVQDQTGKKVVGWWKRWLVTLGMVLIVVGVGIVGFAKGRTRETELDRINKTSLLLPSGQKVRFGDEFDSKDQSSLSVVDLRDHSVASSENEQATQNEGSLDGLLDDHPIDSAAQPTPKKKSNRRRVRGKKKRRDSNATIPILEDAENEDDDDEALEGDRDKKIATSPQLTPKFGNKPLPDLPRELSSTDLLDYHDKEHLTISDKIIGFGSHGTVVLKGTWGGRPVAVKRLLSDFTRLASQEVKLLQASDDHPNVIRYYCQEKRDNFLYIALDLCSASLFDLIESPSKYPKLTEQLDCRKALMDVTRGVKHLHGMKIIHRDIKPQNVLVSQTSSGLKILVSDFGLARRLDQDQSSFAPTANHLAGSLGWRAPECIKGVVRLNEGFDNSSSSSASDEAAMSTTSRLTKAVDLFALGCLYFYTLLSGSHPFGETYNRESNIVKGDAVNIEMLKILGEEGEEASDLIGRLLSNDPSSRPETSECMIHPFFWSSARRLAFLCDASDRFEILPAPTPQSPLDQVDPTLLMLEDGAVDIVGKDWCSKLDRSVMGSLGKYRKYRGGSVRDLLRAMRNKKHHYQDLDPPAQAQLGSLPTGFLIYWTLRYPKLFMHVHRVVRESRLREENMFEGYFREQTS
ncbi:hypothetical protein L204_100383 [Cryptococcus depauperatus]|nr:IRE protein kinase [Cryptococcus depauperatus CBS 7855]